MIRRGFSRRDFIRLGIAGGAAILVTDRFAFAAGEKTDVWVFHGEDKKKLMEACLKTISDNGGLAREVKKLTLKVNAAWWRTPEEGANTHPELADAFIKGCKDRGVKELVIPENPCDPARQSFPKSGLLDVAKQNGVNMFDLRADKNLFKEVDIPNGRKLKQALVGKDFLETDALVNMPVAKHHGAAALTAAMKNWMGSVWDRNFWHRNDLHQCIADYSTFIRPMWTIIDVTRVMLDSGPKGPAKELRAANLLVVSRDQVAADLYVSSLFPVFSPDKARYLAIAREMKIGTTDADKTAVHKIEVV